MNVQALCQQCPVIKSAVEKYGVPTVEKVDLGFMGLVKTINSQMLSTASALTIYNRVLDVLTDTTAQGWLNTDRTSLRTCGLSDAKIDTLTTLATDSINGHLDLNALVHKTSAEIYDILIVYKGIGAWTAKGYALMRLQKEDIFLGEDLGVRDGIQVLLNLKERPSIEFCMEYAQEHFLPYGGTATRLLWHFKENV